MPRDAHPLTDDDIAKLREPMIREAARRVAIDALLRDYADTRASLIGHTSGDMDSDYLTLRVDIKRWCVGLDVPYRPSHLPVHVQIRLQEIDRGDDD